MYRTSVICIYVYVQIRYEISVAEDSTEGVEINMRTASSKLTLNTPFYSQMWMPTTTIITKHTHKMTARNLHNMAHVGAFIVVHSRQIICSRLSDRTAKIGCGTHCFQQSEASPIGQSGANLFKNYLV